MKYSEVCTYNNQNIVKLCRVKCSREREFMEKYYIQHDKLLATKLFIYGNATCDSTSNLKKNCRVVTIFSANIFVCCYLDKLYFNTIFSFDVIGQMEPFQYKRLLSIYKESFIIRHWIGIGAECFCIAKFVEKTIFLPSCFEHCWKLLCIIQRKASQ